MKNIEITLKGFIEFEIYNKKFISVRVSSIESIMSLSKGEDGKNRTMITMSSGEQYIGMLGIESLCRFIEEATVIH